MVKQANITHLARLLELAEAFHSTCIYNEIPFEGKAVEEKLLAMIDMGSVFLNDHGFVCGVLSPLIFNPGYLIAAELAWYCPEGDGQELKQAFEDWAFSNGAVLCQFSTLVNGYTDKLGELLINDKYTPVEVSYVKEL